jgi:hypothetical protein
MSAAHNYELGQVIYGSALLVFREDSQSLRTKVGFVRFALCSFCAVVDSCRFVCSPRSLSEHSVVSSIMIRKKKP